MYRTQPRKWLSHLWRIHVYKSNSYCVSGKSLFWYILNPHCANIKFNNNSLVDIAYIDRATLPTAKLPTNALHVSNPWRICHTTFNSLTGKSPSNLCQRNTATTSHVFFATTVKCVPTHDTTFSTTNALIAAATTPLSCKPIRLLDPHFQGVPFWYVYIWFPLYAVYPILCYHHNHHHLLLIDPCTISNDTILLSF